MVIGLLKKATAFAVIVFCGPSFLAAQSADEVKLNILSALSTPLPITLVGPLLTRDVIVTEDGEGFRATLQDTSLMGLFPLGEVSMRVVPSEGGIYRVSDLQFPKSLDFPGFARINLEGIALDGTWSTVDRSYTALTAELSGLRVEPGQGGQGALSLGRLGFDVQKEPTEADTESRFNITLGDVSVQGLAPTDVTLGEARILLSANGERPVDLYSLLREVVMVAGLQDGGVGLQTLGVSLLGNTYGSVALTLSAEDLNVSETSGPESGFFRAAALRAGLEMEDVDPRDWGAVELSVDLDDVVQEDLVESGPFEVQRAQIRLGGSDLPVADMFDAIQTLGMAGQSRPVPVSDLLDGFLEFGALEFSTEGEALSIEVRDSTFENNERVEGTAFTTGYKSWGITLGLEGLNANKGTVSSRIELDGGSFAPGPLFADEDLRHVNAWFPKTLAYGGQLSNLNEGFLKRLFQDVVINDLNEPVEIALPLILYASASVFEVAVAGNRYETNLFNLEQQGEYRVYPAKVMSIAPFEGRVGMRMTGFDALLAYFEDVLRDEISRGSGAQELSVLKSIAIVFRNLGTQADDGSVSWEIDRPDVNLPEIIVNGTTFYYPDLTQFLPFAFWGAMID